MIAPLSDVYRQVLSHPFGSCQVLDCWTIGWAKGASDLSLHLRLEYSSANIISIPTAIVQVALIHGISTPSIGFKNIADKLREAGFQILLYGEAFSLRSQLAMLTGT